VGPDRRPAATRHDTHPLGCHRPRIPTKAPCGGQVAGPSPADRRKQGLKRSIVTDAGGIPLGAVLAAANRRDDGLLASTLDTLADTAP
jgi:hypothetical protein